MAIICTWRALRPRCSLPVGGASRGASDAAPLLLEESLSKGDISDGSPRAWGPCATGIADVYVGESAAAASRAVMSNRDMCPSPSCSMSSDGAIDGCDSVTCGSELGFNFHSASVASIVYVFKPLYAQQALFPLDICRPRSTARLLLTLPGPTPSRKYRNDSIAGPTRVCSSLLRSSHVSRRARGAKSSAILLVDTVMQG